MQSIPCKVDHGENNRTGLDLGHRLRNASVFRTQRAFKGSCSAGIYSALSHLEKADVSLIGQSRRWIY